MVAFRDECGICSRVLRTTYLRKCERCKRLYCQDCMTPDVSTGDYTRLFCLNCARRVVSPRVVSKYDGLSGHLRFRSAFTHIVKLSFARIDGLIGSNLPMTAFREQGWWNNSAGSAHARGWLDAGWEVQEVNIKEGYVVFKKVREMPSKKRKRAKKEVLKPFTPVPVHAAKPKIPSKTKVSKLYARIKNIERQRTADEKIRGFKPKSQYEKKLFKPHEKPH